MTDPTAKPEGAPVISRRVAAAVVGATPRAVEAWERSAGVSLGASLTIAEVILVCVLSELVDRRVRDLSDFALGLEELLRLAKARPDLERLDRWVAVVGCDFASIREWGEESIADEAGGVLEVPLGPILRSLRDQAFA